jgi:hypothetical protein
MRWLSLLAGLLLFQVPLHAQTTSSTDNAEMTALFDADQAVRQHDWSKADVAAIIKADTERRTATKALLDARKLHTGTDFWHAAFVFQHSNNPSDYLLAHTLAIAAVARGRTDASWIAAATLDRYLQSIGQKQIYGTQFQWSDDEPVTQEPYDRTLISDALRTTLGVPTQAEQDKRREKLQAERGK